MVRFTSTMICRDQLWSSANSWWFEEWVYGQVSHDAECGKTLTTKLQRNCFDLRFTRIKISEVYLDY